MSSTAPVEVRTCPKCQAPAVVQVFEWSHTTFGANTGQTTRELRCQGCGAKFVIHPRASVIGLFVAGALLSLTCIGLPFLFVAWRRWTVESRIPVAIGAPPPLMRFRGGAPLRTCGACSGTATAMKITRHTHNGIPTGTEYEYVCAGCGREFTVESPLGQAISGIGGLACGAGAAAFLLEGTTPGWRFGGGGVFALVSFFLAWQVVDRLANRFRHPAKPDVDAFIG